MTEDPWYSKGLRFECQRCGNCCGGAPGTVRVTDEEILALAEYLGLVEEEFRERYTRRAHLEQRALREKSSYECIFYNKSTGCAVYARRPRQCRTWPFWRAVVCTPERWEEDAKQCPGMNKGPLHTRQYIQRRIEDDGTFGGQRKRGES